MAAIAAGLAAHRDDFQIRAFLIEQAHGLASCHGNTVPEGSRLSAASQNQEAAYLRILLIQAASFGAWLQNAAPRLHRSKLATALAIAEAPKSRQRSKASLCRSPRPGDHRRDAGTLIRRRQFASFWLISSISWLTVSMSSSSHSQSS